MTNRLTFAPAPVTPRTPLGRRLECVAQFPYTLLEMLDAEGGAAARCGLFSNWDDTQTPRTATPVRFRRVVVRKRDAFGTGWDHYSKSSTFRYGY